MSEIKWVNEVNGVFHVGSSPTAADLLQLANEKLTDDEEMSCCKSDMRIGNMKHVQHLLHSPTSEMNLISRFKSLRHKYS